MVAGLNAQSELSALAHRRGHAPQLCSIIAGQHAKGQTDRETPERLCVSMSLFTRIREGGVERGDCHPDRVGVTGARQ